jgi:hypothetical protein
MPSWHFSKPRIPAFLLAYYRGWGGVATALAAAMATLAISNVVLIWRGSVIDELMLLIVLSIFIALCLAVGWLSEALSDRPGRLR